MKYTLVIVALLFSLAGRGQEDEKDFQLGFTLSPTLSWLTDDGSSLKSDGSKPGFSYGVLADFGFAKNYFFSTAFALTSVNSKAETALSSDVYKLQYIEIPLTLKLKSNSIQAGRFYGQFGVGTGINVSSKMDSDGKGTNETKENRSVSSAVNVFRLGLIAGGGAEWNLGRNLSALTGVTFNNGFTKTFKEGDSKNPFVTFHLGVFF
jgi:hypothetical protein